MLILGLILLILGLVFASKILWVLALILLVVGGIAWVSGHRVY